MTMPTHIDLIAIGGSAGALDVLLEILPALPVSFAIPIVLVLHVPPNRPSLLERIFAAKCSLSVKEVDDKDPLRPRTLYIAPPNYHTLVERSGHLALSVDDPVHFSRPSIDVLFESVAEACGRRALAVLLSGSNEDGAGGLSVLSAAGARTIVQSPETAMYGEMPRAALALTSQHLVLSPREITHHLASLPGQQRQKEYV